MLKTKDLRDKTTDELNEELNTLRAELLKARLELHSRQLENTASIKNAKRSISKVLTILKEKENEGEKNA